MTTFFASKRFFFNLVRQQMKRLLTPTYSKTVATIVVAMATPSFASDAEWKLMSRHGECANFSSLTRVFPDMGTVSDPEAFASFAKRKGLKVITREIAAPIGRMVAVEVPEKELALWFANRTLCASTVKP